MAVKRWRPPEFLAGDLMVVGLMSGLGAIALTGLTRVEATGAVVVIACIWWFGWPWYVHRRDHQLTILRSLAAASPDGFQDTIVELFQQRGYDNVHRAPGRAGDVRCLDRAGRWVLVRAQRRSPGRRIGSRDMKRFIREVRGHHAANRGIFVTTSTFTPRAFTLARKAGIGLMEGRQVALAISAEGEHREFDRRLHEPSGPRWTAPRLIRIAVMAGLVAMGLTLWIGPAIDALRP